MSDDKTKVGQDKKFVNLNEDYEVRGWCRVFNCIQEQLRAAVKTVGNSVDAVREHLKNRT